MGLRDKLRRKDGPPAEVARIDVLREQETYENEDATLWVLGTTPLDANGNTQPDVQHETANPLVLWTKVAGVSFTMPHCQARRS